MSGTVRIGHSRLARVALAVLLGLVAWLGLARTSAWGEAAQKAVAGQIPPPVGQGTAKSHGSRAASAQLSVNVDLAVRESAQLDGVIAAASTPGSPSYGHYLTEGEYMARYAPTDEQVAAVESWLASQGLQVTGASKDNLLVHAQGSTAAMEKAFAVGINNYTAGEKEFYANDSAPSVPTDLAVSAVSGLSDYYKAVADNTCFSTLCGYTGNDFRAAYDVSGNAEGQTIAYTLWGQPIPQSTYENYTTVTGTPELKIGAGNEHIEFKEVGGASSVNNSNEIALDTESAHVVAPGAHHIYYLAKEPTVALLETALNEASGSPAKVISNSWEFEGACPIIGPGIETILEKAAALGKTFFFSTGDHGAAHGCAYPSSSQFALAVGGTNLEVGAGSAWKNETAIADGGNCNNSVARPSWQTGIGTPHVFPEGACTGRVTPDVSAVSCAAEEKLLGECFLLVWEGKVGLSGGTSLSTPVWAAFGAVWNKNNAAASRPGIGFANPLLYALGNDPVTYARDFHDITAGSNGFAAAKGWDEATGWGSPNVANLADNEAQLAYTGATEAVHGQSVTLSATLTDKGTSQAVPGHMVHFAVGAESCEAATNSGGVASCGVTINDAPGGYTLTAKASATAAYLESSTSSGFTVTAPPEPPDFGRCLKAPGEKVGGKTIYHGEFTTATCTTKSAEHTGKFEWSPGPGPKPFFSLAIKPLTTIKIETPGKHSLVCTGVTIGEGQVTGLQTVEIGIILNGCSDEGEKCGNVGEGELEIFPLFGKLGWQNRALKKVDLQLTGSGFVFSSYKCPKKEVLLGTTGILLPVTVNKFTNKVTDKFTESKGKQVPNALEGGPTLFFEEDRIGSEPPSETIEGAGLSATLLQTYEEKMEINTAF